MDSFVCSSPETRLATLLREKERQDQELATAAQKLAAYGHAEFLVSHAALERIAEACLVSLPTLSPALRG